MAYAGSSLVPISNGGFLESTVTVWLYNTADSEATVKGAGYFSDGASRGVKAGDVVIVINPAGPNAYILQFSSATTVGATVVVT
jgi:hypothetical protein